MPMDYDDNETSHHNLQLAGEGRSRSPSALRPYDFPKFDFDDSLQGHLRFDSLVETEVFLGIQSQEDNQWIEDFSRGSNGMEFNSTPRDPCSISRRNNVWSEATSTESVEMLLKSVGQEDMNPGASNLPESDANVDQGTLVKVVESSSNNAILKDGNDAGVTNSDSTLPSDEVLKEKLENPSGNFNQHVLGGNGGTLEIEGKHSHHAEATNEGLEEFKTSVEEALGEKSSLTFPSITDTVDSDIGTLSTSKACQQVDSSLSGQEKHVSSKTVPEESAIPQGNKGIHTSQQANPDPVRESLENLVKGDFVLSSSEGAFTNKSFTSSFRTVIPDNVLATSNETNKQLDKCEAGSSMDSIVPHSDELGDRASPKQMLDPTVELPHKLDNDNLENVSMSPLKCVGVSESNLTPMEVNEAVTTDEGSGNVPPLGCPQDSLANEEESSARLVGDDVNVHMEVIQENLDQSRADFSESKKDTCKATDADKEVPSGIENVDNKNFVTLKKDHETQLLEIRRGPDGDTTIHNLLPQTCNKQESANQVSNLTTVDVSNAPTDYPDIGQSEPSAIGSLQPDNEQEVDNTLKVEVGMASDNVGTPICEISAMDKQQVEEIEDISSNVPSPMAKENVDSVSGGVTLSKEEEKESGQTADIDKTSCGSPTIISSSEPSQTVNDTQVTNEVGGIHSSSENLKRIESSIDDSGFTFKINALPDTTIDTQPGKNWSPFPDVEKAKVLEETAPSSKGKTGRMSSPKTPRNRKNAKVSDGGETVPATLKGTSERKGRRGSAKGTTTKENVKKGNQSKGPTQENVPLKVENVSKSLSSPLYSPHVKVGPMQKHYENVEVTNKKPSDAVGPTMPNLPDLNSSSSSSPPFRQPFSDLQQVQLRAQIFVYGSLIQGIVPDEACMVSAFGQYEGGRVFWERTWRAAAERVQSQKSTTTLDTPRSQSGARASDTVKQGSHSSKVPVTPMSKTNSKETPVSTLSPMIPLSSPLWNISTPSQNSLTSNPMHKGHGVEFQHALTPVQSYQGPQIRAFVGHTSWPLQTGFPSPWLASPQTSSFNSNAQFRPVTMTETVKLTPVKDTSSMLTSSGKITTSSPAVHIVSPSPALGGISSPLHTTKSVPSASQPSVDPKPRKRKKVPISDPTQITSVSEPQPGAIFVSSIPSLPITPVRATIPISPPTSVPIMSTPTTDIPTLPSVDLPKKSDLDISKGVTSSEEMTSKVAEAKTQAEDAATLADAAIAHCEDLWGQLANLKGSGLTSESEAKSASFAAAIAAAVSVAKAAAAAAKIAYNAALQAKLMADEGIKSCGVGPSSEKASPSSIVRSNSVIDQSSSILVAAKEAAKRRVEAASVAARQAENMDAIVKAAELAAAAVTQAGKIVSMGEPLPLNDLIEAGTEGYWKLPQPSVVLAEKARGKNVVEDNVHATEGLDGSKNTDEKEIRNGVDHETPKIDPLLRTSNAKNNNDDLAPQVVDGIKEGSFVEVFNPRSVQKSAWYTANVLNVEKGKAYVLYNDIVSDEGSGNVKEWVPLESEGDRAPVVRIAHSSQLQKTRKRRRAALADYGWSVGDKVDVWIDDCWWEGVVTEKNEKDDTTLKVHISAQGETSTVGACNLRASRSWINGKWIESSSSKGHNASEQQSDTPQEKRQKLGSPIASKSKDKESNNLESTVGTTEQSKSLNLSTSETTFDIGKTTTNDNKLGSRRPVRTNQQKEGSRVVFGVPKPTGKKRKFMEVSKHFSTNKTEKSVEPNDSVKFTKYLMPQGAPSRGWKLPTRNDTKEKRIVESKPRVLSTRKAQRTLPQRENSRSKSTQDTDTITDQTTEDDSVNHDENTSDKSIEGTEAPLSSLLPHSQSTSSKKVSSSSSKSDRPYRGRLGPSNAKLSKIEEDKVYTANTGKSTLDDVSEPRRSNRRIQPTHRLLEGLQSSMAIPKMPAVSHDKSRRNLPARGK